MATNTHPPAEALNEEGPGRRHGRRRRQLTGLVAGFAVGWLVGFLVEYVIGSRLVTGSASDPFSIAFGLPAALGIMFALFGLMLATTREVAVVDAPVREPRYRHLGRAATSERGQMQGSTVAPRTPDDVERR
jgi:hypothetical protein